MLKNMYERQKKKKSLHSCIYLAASVWCCRCPTLAPRQRTALSHNCWSLNSHVCSKSLTVTSLPLSAHWSTGQERGWAHMASVLSHVLRAEASCQSGSGVDHENMVRIFTEGWLSNISWQQAIACYKAMLDHRRENISPLLWPTRGEVCPKKLWQYLSVKN